MISIRECVEVNDLEGFKDDHVLFVAKEVNKRIDFYLNLFETIAYLQGHINTRVTTIKAKIGKHLHHAQYVPFIKLIFIKEGSFNKSKYNNLKDLSLMKPEAVNYTLVIGLLNLLRKRTETIIGLDLSVGNQSNSRYYRLSKVEYEPIKFLLFKIFDYDWFLDRASDDSWGAYQLTEALGLKVCSYCNRQYTFTLSKGLKKITKPELDHFLPKATNPLLALSFFNLIPSCTICNRDCKGKLPFTYDDYMSPYEVNLKHELMQYDYFPTSYLGSIGEKDDIKVFIKTSGVNLEPSLEKKIKGNIKAFCYSIIVNEHKDVVQEIIRKRHISNDKYLETLQKTFPDAKLGLDEAYRLAYGNFYSEKEFSKRPLAKLTKDIALGVGSLKNHSK